MTDQRERLRAELAARIAAVMPVDDRRTTAIPGLSLSRRSHPAGPLPGAYEPSLAVVAQGRKRVILGSSSFNYDEGRYLLTSLDLPILGQVVEASPARPFYCLLISLDLAAAREMLSREDLPPADPPRDPAMITGQVTAELLSACCRLMALLDQPRDIAYLSGLIQREILYRLLCGAEGARLRAIATLGEQSHRTARAVAWIRANYSRPLRIEEMAEIAGMGVSTFHHHFRTMTAMSPLQYQKQMRLHAARGLMLWDGRDAAEAAFAVGYESASQFNREYSRFFGQPPMRDVRTLRGLPAPDPVS